MIRETNRRSTANKKCTHKHSENDENVMQDRAKVIKSDFNEVYSKSVSVMYLSM